MTLIDKESISIIIVNWNSGDLLKKSIDSILLSDISTITCNIVVVDNASVDDSLTIISRDERVSIIKNESNKGFGFACNQGIKASFSDYILLLNPDTEVRNRTILESINFIRENPSVAVLGCKQVDEKGNTLRTCSRFFTLSRYLNKLTGLSKLLPQKFPSYLMTEWPHDVSKPVDHVMGSYYFVRTKDIKEIGLFDEDYFVYFEDLDLSYRIKEKIGEVFYNSEIEIYHETGGTSKNVKARRLYYSSSAILTYSKKRLDSEYYAVFFIALFIEPLLRIIASLVKLDLKGLMEIIGGYKILYMKRLFRR